TAGIVAEATSWRVSLALVGVLCVAASTVLYLTFRPAQTNTTESRFFALYRSILRSRSAIAATISSFLGSLFWFAWSTYIVVFFETVYGLTRGTASTFALTLGLGVLVGSQVARRLDRRHPHRLNGLPRDRGVLLYRRDHIGAHRGPLRPRGAC